MPVVDTPNQAISLEYFQHLIDAAVPESQYLDYKQVTGNKPQSLVKPIAAMANGGGGILVLGVKADRELPTSIVPFEIDGFPEALVNVLASRIDPPPHYALEIVEVSGEKGMGLGLIRIFESEAIPHAMRLHNDGQYAFHLRVGSRTVPLSEAIIADMYERRFRRSRILEERLADLTREIGLEKGNAASTAYIAIVPVSRNRRAFRISRGLLNDLKQTNREWTPDPIFGDHLGEPFPSSARARFKRLEFSNDSSFSHQYRTDYGWVEFHDDGAFVRTIPAQSEIIDRQALPFFIGDRFTVDVLSALAWYWSLARKFNITGEVAVRAGITTGTSTRLVIGAIRPRVLEDSEVLRNSVQTDLSAQVEDFRPAPSLIATGKEFLDDLFSAFGHEECPFLSRDGEVVIDTIDRRLWPTIGEWAADHNIRVPKLDPLMRA